MISTDYVEIFEIRVRVKNQVVDKVLWKVWYLATNQVRGQVYLKVWDKVCDQVVCQVWLKVLK